MNRYIKCALIMILFAFAVSLMPAQAATNTWNTTTGDWSVAGNWSGGLPGAGDDIVITNAGAYVYLTNSTPALSSLMISNATLSCSNWDTTIYLTNLTIAGTGVLTCAGPFTNTAMSNRVNLVCYSNVVIQTNGAINVTGKGYAGGIQNAGWPTWNANGPGACPVAAYFGGASANGGGGGYGGAAANIGGTLPNPATVYGSAEAPLFPGSGGAAGYYSGSTGGNGGGAVCITAAQVVVNGGIIADASAFGGSELHQSGGSGGGIYITCSTITGAYGTITANGSAGGWNGGAGGGGGRIAVRYNTSLQSNITSVPTIRFSVASGLGGDGVTYAYPGTLYFDDNYFLSPTNLFTCQWVVPGFTNWSVADLPVSNVWIRMTGLSQLTVSNALSIVTTDGNKYRFELTNGTVVNCGSCQINGGSLRLGGDPMSGTGSLYGPTLNCTGDLTLTNAGRLYVSAGTTVAGAAGYGGLVSVGGNMRVATNTWIYPAAHPTNGAAVLFRMDNLNLDRGGGINADYLGYIGSRAPGPQYYASAKGEYGPGSPASGYYSAIASGHGGQGGRSRTSAPGGPAYGSLFAPVTAGSGCLIMDGIMVRNNGPNGGGSVQIRATNTVTIRGTITANGTAGGYYYAGGASGGGIYITCATFIGDSNGILRANGGDGVNHASYGTGGGGGGRIAVWRTVDNSPSAIATYVNGGVSGGGNVLDESGGNGTVVWAWTSSTKMWNTTSGDWSVSGNWLGGVPVAGDDVAICAGGTVYLTNSTPWLSSLIVDNGKLSFSNANGTLCVSNLTIQNNGTAICWGAVSCSNCLLDNGALVLNAATSGPIFNCSGDLTLTNAGRLYVTAGLSVAGAETNYGGLINVGGDIRVATNSWIYPAAHPTNGAAVLFNMRNLTLSSGGGINADYLGYIGSRQDGTTVQGWYGPGMFIGGDVSGTGYGSGYGGAGGRGPRSFGLTGGPAYGSSNAPVAPGSGSYAMSGIGTCGLGEDGGGSVQLRASKTVAIQGTITANGQAGHLYYGGGASGGGIYIRCYTFTGNSNGVLQANGGNGYLLTNYGTGGGGGGRIAVWRVIDNSPSAIATYVNGGAAGADALTQAGTNGTVVWGWAPRPNTVIRFY